MHFNLDKILWTISLNDTCDNERTYIEWAAIQSSQYFRIEKAFVSITTRRNLIMVILITIWVIIRAGID